MEDEISTVEQTTEDESQEQTTDFEDNGSEADQNSSNDFGRGDLRVPLKEERTRRQELERNLEDPDFIYQQAQRLGLTQEQEQQLRDRADASYRPVDIASEVTKVISIEKARDKYPELRKDEDLQVMVTSMAAKMRTSDFVKAADKVFAKINKANEEAVAQAAIKAQQESAEQEKAQNVTSTSNQTTQDTEIERLQKESKSWDKRVQMKALIELEKRKMRTE